MSLTASEVLLDAVDDTLAPGEGVEVGEQADLAIIDRKMQVMWEALGFTVHMLGDFNPFAERQGVVHCIKKYLERGD